MTISSLLVPNELTCQSLRSVGAFCIFPASGIQFPLRRNSMLKASAGKILPTTITGSLPRPSWYTENLGNRSFLEAMVYTRFREQYTDALAMYLKEQVCAGLDIVTDGDCRFNQDIGGQSWTS